VSGSHAVVADVSATLPFTPNAQSLEAAQTPAAFTVVVNALSALQGGGQTYLLNLFRYLPPALDAHIFVIAPESWSVSVSDERIALVPIPAAAVQNPYRRALWERFHLPPLLKSLGADVLFCPGGIIGSNPPPGCRTAVTFQNMIPFSPEQTRKYGFSSMRVRNWILKRQFSRSAARADLLICLTQYARGVMESAIGHAPKSVVDITHGVGSEFRGNAIPAHGPEWLPQDGYFLYAGTLDHYKAQVEVVEAFALLRQRRCTREKLLLVGAEYREYADRVRRTVKALSLEDEVMIRSAVPYAQMPALYRHASVNLFASECENCPNILLEALAAGRPVLCSNMPPMPEIAGDAAVYFDPRSPEDLAAKWAALLADSQRMQDLARRAADRSLAFDWQETAQRTWSAIAALARQ
jgi:glycosyltransferase involved in cell wall biosynthesis